MGVQVDKPRGDDLAAGVDLFGAAGGDGADGAPVTTVERIGVGDSLRAVLKDGTVEVGVTAVEISPTR